MLIVLRSASCRIGDLAVVVFSSLFRFWRAELRVASCAYFDSFMPGGSVGECIVADTQPVFMSCR